MAGLPKIKRTHAKNYIAREADSRLLEVITPYQKQGLNALGVDSYEVLLFLKKASAQVCSCREIQQTSDLGEASVVQPKSGIGSNNQISIDWRRPLFGEPNEALFEEDENESSDGYEFDEDENDRPVSNQLLETSSDCGICYKTGYVPGFVLHGKHRHVLTTHDVVNHSGYTIDRTSAPHRFEQLSNTGWVEFAVHIPRYFKKASYSIRNNHANLDADISIDGLPLSRQVLASYAGLTATLRVSCRVFTHLVLVFDLGTDAVRANIAQLSQQSDWTQFVAIGNLNVILPMTIPDIPIGSLIVVPKIGLTLTVTDQTYLRPVDGRNLDWSLNTRVCQPQEPATRIARLSVIP